MIIAIDGTSGSGKSTLASKLSGDLHLININSGNLYRAFSYSLLQVGIKADDEKAVAAFAESVSLEYNDDGSVTADGKRLGNAELHTLEVEKATNITASCIPVRKKINRILNAFASGRDVVCEGRDICSVVFPDAEFKFYIDADVSVRAARRALQYKKDYKTVLEDIRKRDEGDFNRPFGALKRMPDSIFIDTSNMTFDEVYKKIRKYIGK